MTNLPGKQIILGVCGGIAAYKSVDLASRLVQSGATVRVAMTAAAREFVTARTFRSITKQAVHGSVFEDWTEAEHGHISLAEDADAIVIAPATANTVAKLALGLADDMLSVTCLSAIPRGIPIVIAPAMEYNMYLNPTTQSHLATLIARGARVVGPERGRLASGTVGLGRMSEPGLIADVLDLVLGSRGPLAGRKIVVSAGATREAIDPIRILTNRSTGKMGHSIARAALLAGASVVLITTADLPPVEGAETVPVESALEMLDAIRSHVPGSDALVMAAAVADYRPSEVAEHKIKKSDDDLVVRLVRNPDILASLDTPGTLRIGFAAETRDLEENARRKLALKRLDMIVANDARVAMGSDHNAVTLYFTDGSSDHIPLSSKDEVAKALIQRIATMIAGQSVNP